MSLSHPLHNQKFKNDEALQKISGELVKMRRHEVKENNAILRGIILNKIVKHMQAKDREFKEMYENMMYGGSFHKNLKIILNKIVKLMQAKDRDFKEMYENVMYGGSFYKNLKVSRPDEYDLNLVVKLPVDYGSLQIQPDDFLPGYVKIRVLETAFSRNENFWNTILSGDYLDQIKFRSWIQSVLDRALADFRQGPESNNYIIRCSRSSYHITYRQAGPAFTITVVTTRNNEHREISFDLVPCLLFRDGRLIPGFRQQYEKWIAIAKPLRRDVGNNVQLLWRAGFYDDEKRLLAGHNKPIIRIMKKLRDIKGWHQLKSYFIETLFLNELEKHDFANNCERASRTNVLMYMLRVLQEKLFSGQLSFYWNERLNMYADVPRLREIASELQTIINRIDNEITTDKNILLTIFRINH